MNDEELRNAHKAAVELLRKQISVYESVSGPSITLDLLNGYLSELKRAPLSKVVGFLRHATLGKADRRKKEARLPAFENLALEEIEHLISSDHLPRKFLEGIAIQYFHVPKGSMRSFRNVDALKAKLEALITNERARRTIGDIAHKTRT